MCRVGVGGALDDVLLLEHAAGDIGQPQVAVAGGPFNSTQTLVTFLYSFGVMRMQVGFGSAVGVILFVICVTLAFSYKRVFMRND